MPAILASILAFIVESTLARVVWASIAYWFCMGLIPVVVGQLNGLVGDPFSLITPEMWWASDLIGFDILIRAAISATVVRFIIRRLPK